MKTICIFEDEGYANLLPLTYTKPVFELKCGVSSLFEKIKNCYGHIVCDLLCREYLKETVKHKHPALMVEKITTSSCCLFINGRIIMNSDIAKHIPVEGPDEIFMCKGQIAAVRLNKNSIDEVKDSLNGIIEKSFWDLIMPRLKSTEVQARFIKYYFDLVHQNAQLIAEEFDNLTKQSKLSDKKFDGVYLINKKRITICEGAAIKPNVVLDAEAGPIFIGKGVTIMSGSTIIGPVFIGEKSIIKAGAKIYGGTSIGEMCKVGGEVEGSIIQSYSNKQHDGFMGHSYIGQWVNWGAGTNNSDLKNNYTNVKVTINGEMIDSGHMFVGLCMADHSKCAINTMFNTGTVVGVASNIFGSNFPPKYVPSFSWGGTGNITVYDIKKAKQVAQKVLERRKIEFTKADSSLFDCIFEATIKEREKFGI